MRNPSLLIAAIVASLRGQHPQFVPLSGPSIPGRTNRRSLWKRRRAAGFNRGGYRSKSKRAKKFTT